MAEWPKTKCLTNGCHNVVERRPGLPRFCDTCRKNYGRWKSDNMRQDSEQYWRNRRKQ